MRKIILMIVLCLTGSLLNIAVNKLCILAGLPLYLDTILTISITLTCGLLWGALCGTLTNLISHAYFGYGWEGYLFVICNIATALVAWLFMRLFPRELNLSAGYSAAVNAKPVKPVNKSNLFNMVMDRVIVLIIFSFALCLAMSILGGFIASIILTLSSSYGSAGSGITALFSATMFKGNTPVLIAEIVSRIPVNIVDRLISAFAGYGIALCIRRLMIKLSSAG